MNISSAMALAARHWCKQFQYSVPEAVFEFIEAEAGRLLADV